MSGQYRKRIIKLVTKGKGKTKKLKLVYVTKPVSPMIKWLERICKQFAYVPTFAHDDYFYDELFSLVYYDKLFHNGEVDVSHIYNPMLVVNDDQYDALSQQLQKPLDDCIFKRSINYPMPLLKHETPIVMVSATLL